MAHMFAPKLANNRNRTVPEDSAADSGICNDHFVPSLAVKKF